MSVPMKRHPMLADKDELRRIVSEQNAKTGFIPDSTATALRAREKMLAQGVHPQDNIGSCGIIAARDKQEPATKVAAV